MDKIQVICNSKMIFPKGNLRGLILGFLFFIPGFLLAQYSPVEENCKKYMYAAQYDSVEILVTSRLSQKELKPSEKVYLLYQLGDVAKNRGRYPQAIDYFQRALQESRNSEFRNAQKAIIYHHLAGTYYKMEKLDKATEFARQSINYAKYYQRPEILTAQNLNVLGEDWVYKHNYSSALMVFNQAVDCYIKGGQPYELPVVYTKMCNVYSLQKQNEKAIAICLKSVENADAYKYPAYRIMSYRELSRAYQRAGKYKESLEYLLKSNVVRDSMEFAKQDEKFAMLETQYKTKLKEQEIKSLKQLGGEKENIIRHQRVLVVVISVALLLLVLLFIRLFSISKSNRNYISKLEEQRVMLADRNSTIETLLKEIHHRVKNNLQLVTSLLDFQSEVSPDVKVQEMIADAQSRIKSIALLHQKLYQSSEFKYIIMENYLSDLVNNLLPIGGTTIKASVSGHQLIQELDRALPVGLIINELVTNSVKYAFSGVLNPEINIEIKQEKEGSVWLVYADNGIGLPANMDPYRTESLGLKLIDLLMKQLGGNWKYENENGAKFVFNYAVSD